MDRYVWVAALLKQLRNEGFPELVKFRASVRLKHHRKDIVHFLRILKLHRYLKRAKLRYGNAVTADILW